MKKGNFKTILKSNFKSQHSHHFRAGREYWGSACYTFGHAVQCCRMMVNDLGRRWMKLDCHSVLNSTMLNVVGWKCCIRLCQFDKFDKNERCSSEFNDDRLLMFNWIFERSKGLCFLKSWMLLESAVEGGCHFSTDRKIRKAVAGYLVISLSRAIVLANLFSCW